MPDNVTGTLVTEFDFPDSKFDASRVVHNATTINASVFRPTTHEHTFSVNGTEFINSVLRNAMASVTPLMRFRMGIRSGEKTRWMAWQNHIVTAHASEPKSRGEGAGFILRVVTADQLQAMDRASKVVARRGKISAIVEEIAGENGLRSVVEPTATEGVYLQSFMTDARFIRQRLMPRAVSVKRAAQYLLFVRDNVLHFHPPDRDATLRTVDYHGSLAFKLITSEHSQQLFSEGVGGVRSVIHNPYTGETMERVSDPKLTLRCAGALYPTGDLDGGERNELYHLSYNNLPEAVAIAQNVYDYARASSNRLELRFSSFIDLDVGSFIELIHNLDDQPSPFGGLYQVVEAIHMIKNATVVSVYTVQRGEVTNLRSDTLARTAGVAYAINEVKPALEAPGRDLNRAALQANSASSRLVQPGS